jgi:CRP-like cAMP-binding protein
MALLTGSPHATSAIAREDSVVMMVPREALQQVIRGSAGLRLAIADLLNGPRVGDYLVTEQQMTDQDADSLIRAAVAGIQNDGKLPPAAEFRGSEQFSDIVNHVRRVDFFADLPSDEVHEIASRVYLKQQDQGYTFFYRGEQADRMFIVQSGEVTLLDAEDTQRSAIRLKQKEAFGAMSFVTGARHAVTAVAATDTAVWVLLRVDFDQLLDHCPTLSRAIQHFLQRRDVETYLHDKHHFDPDMAASWVRRAVRSMDLGKLIPHAGTLRATLSPQHGAPIAIWLGILLDGIPESLVIGSSMLHGGVSLSLIAGLFLSNYPEALSSSVGMRQQGINFRRILLMWTSLMLITGIGAALGNLFFREAPAVVFSFVEGIAAGAMLTMIAETMLPEAYFKGGSVVGFSTLLGFLAAIFFKSIG